MKYWFVQKKYGWGITPCTKEGWLCTGVLVLAILAVAKITNLFGTPNRLDVVNYFIGLTLLVVGFFYFLRKKIKGKLKWRWGK